MINPYTMEVVNRERLKDLDRELAGLGYSRPARPRKRRRFRAALAMLGSFLVATGTMILQRAEPGASMNACRGMHNPHQ